MYHIAFFEYDEAFLDCKLSHFVGFRHSHLGAKRYLTDLSLCRPQFALAPFLSKDMTRRQKKRFSNRQAYEATCPESRMQSLKDLPPSVDGGHPYFWFLHDGLSSLHDPSTAPVLPLYEPISFAQVNTTLHAFAQRYQWVILPWGGMDAFNSFAFVSTEAALWDRFVTCSANNEDGRNLLIALYEVPGLLEAVCHTVLFEEYNMAGHRVWETCHGDKIPPYVVSSEVFHHDGAPEGYFEDLNIFTYHSGYVQAAEATYDALGPLGVCDLYVYRPRTKAAFLAMLNRRFPSDPSFDPTHLARPEPAAVLPGTTPWATMQALLKKLSYSEEPLTLSASPVCLAHVPWFYATSCGDGYYYSLFVTQDSSQLTTLVALSGEENFRLIACF